MPKQHSRKCTHRPHAHPAASRVAARMPVGAVAAAGAPCRRRRKLALPSLLLQLPAAAAASHFAAHGCSEHSHAEAETRAAEPPASKLDIWPSADHLVA